MRVNTWLARVATALSLSSFALAVPSQKYTWKNVKIGGGGGFVPGIVFNTKEKGLAYARTDIGGAYRLNADDSWTPLLDWTDHERWNNWGVDALATDPVEPNRLYLATGMYTNSWDSSNGQILISTDRGASFNISKLPFKVGGNMPGRGIGERLAVDPKSNNILYFGARSGNGLWKSTDYGKTWAKVASFPSVGTYIPVPGDTNDYNTDIVGIAWVTFDSTTGTSGRASPRIFVGVANKDSQSIFVSSDAGATWSAVAGQPTGFIPHKGVLSSAEKTLFVSYSDGAGPYDGNGGAVYKYSIESGTWTNITPVSGDNLYFGFGGVAVDMQRTGTIMVAALNSWYPDGQIFRSTDSGATWSPLWSWGNWPELFKHYSYSNSKAPWLGPNYPDTEAGNLQIGWMMESLEIDPFDSNHWLYGTGATIYGGHDLLQWDAKHNVSIASLADGLEETAILGLISPPSGPPLLSAVGDLGGFVHNSLSVAPATGFKNPNWATASDIDFAGNTPSIVVRVGTGDSSSGKQVAISRDSGSSWSQHYGAADNVSGGKIAVSANGDSIVWKSNGNGVLVSQNMASFAPVSTLPSSTTIVTSDKKDNSVFYAAAGSNFYVSTDGGKTFVAKGSLGASTSTFEIAVNPTKTGDVWVSTDKGLFHSVDSGATFTVIAGISQAWGVALGASASTGGYPAIYAAANVNVNGVGYFKSDDQGASWVQINDPAHGFGSASANVVAADSRVYGRVYVGTNGRGIFYGDAAGTTPPQTSAGTSVTTPPSTPSTSSGVVTTPGTSLPASSTSVATPTATASPWGQCGGNNWTGPTTCPAGFVCRVGNEWYSQCVSAS